MWKKSKEAWIQFEISYWSSFIKRKVFPLEQIPRGQRLMVGDRKRHQTDQKRDPILYQTTWRKIIYPRRRNSDQSPVSEQKGRTYSRTKRKLHNDPCRCHVQNPLHLRQTQPRHQICPRHERDPSRHVLLLLQRQLLHPSVTLWIRPLLLLLQSHVRDQRQILQNPRLRRHRNQRTNRTICLGAQSPRQGHVWPSGEVQHQPLVLLIEMVHAAGVPRLHAAGHNHHLGHSVLRHQAVWVPQLFLLCHDLVYQTLGDGRRFRWCDASTAEISFACGLQRIVEEGLYGGKQRWKDLINWAI